MKNPSQKKIVNDYLRGTGRSLTEDQARTGFGIVNLRAVATTLRNDGLIVNTTPTRFGTEYSMPMRDENGSRAQSFGAPLKF